MRTSFVTPRGSGSGRLVRTLRDIAPDTAAALPGWLAARAVVVAALELSRFLSTHLQVVDPAIPQRAHQGLLAWDASWYRDIAAMGYTGLPRDAMRFFPLLPSLTRVVRVAFSGNTGLALLVITNVAALVLGALLHRLVVVETGDRDMARRAAWLVALAPPAFVLVMGYSESLFMALGVGAFLALRTRHWGWAAALGLLAALTRPLGVFLVAPAAIEAARGFTALPWRKMAARLIAVVAPLIGTGTFLLWSAVAYGDGLLPIHVQQQVRLRGRFIDPLRAVFHESRGITHGQHVGSGLHVPWVIGLSILAVICLRRWPLSYGVFAVLTLLAAASSANLDSFERYGLSAFPLVLVAASLTASGRLERLLLTVTAAAMGGYAVLAFLNASVP